MIRLILDVLGLRLDVDLGWAPEPYEDPGPQPEGVGSAVLERAPSWDHDHRQPVGFTPRSH